MVAVRVFVADSFYLTLTADRVWIYHARSRWLVLPERCAGEAVLHAEASVHLPGHAGRALVEARWVHTVAKRSASHRSLGVDPVALHCTCVGIILRIVMVG